MIFMNSFLRKFQIMIGQSEGENLFKNVCLRSLVSFSNLTSSTLVQSCIVRLTGFLRKGLRDVLTWTMSWSPTPSIIVKFLTKSGLLVKKRSKIEVPRVGVSTI